MTAAQRCDAQKWPRPVPDVIGLSFDDAWGGSLLCWTNIKGISPDGTDVTETKGPSTGWWTIQALTPPPGTPVMEDAVITANLVPMDPNAPPAFRPCDWVTKDEAKEILGFSTVEVSPADDYQGAVEPFCAYLGARDGQLVNSTLILPGGLLIDPETELEVAKSLGPGSAVTGLFAIDAYCARGAKDSELAAVLSGGRVYRINAFNGETCDQLKKFAAAALRRIPAES